MAGTILDATVTSQEFAIAQETTRREHEVAMHKRNARLELLRTAKEIIIENKRNKPVTERDVSEAEIVAFATTLEGFLDN
jgi:hypothetical protein